MVSDVVSNDEERREAERLAKVYAERAMIAHNDRETFPNAGRVAIDAFIAGRESMREEDRYFSSRVALPLLESNLQAERQRSAKLAEALRQIRDATAGGRQDLRTWGWADNAIAEFDASLR